MYVSVFIYGLLIIASLALQTTIFPLVPFIGISPDLILILVVVFSLLNGGVFGAKFGFVAGLALDLSIGYMVGLNAVTKMIVGLVVGTLSQRFFKENYVVPVSSVLMATWLDQFLYLGGTFLFGSSVPWNLALQRVIVPLGFYNSALTLLLYLRLYYLNRKIAYWDELAKRAG